MTAATASSLSAPVSAARDRVPFSGLLWLTWRQHRLAIVSTLVAVGALAGMLYWDSADVAHSGSTTLLAMVVVPASAGLIAIFWGAPLLAREYEQQTHLLVWSQDVSVARWLLGKIVVLAPVLVVLWAVLGSADGIVAHNDWVQYPSVVSYGYSSLGFIGNQFAPFGSIGFEAWIPLQIGYVLFGFTLGLLVGALVRRTMMAIGLTLAGFVAVRILIAGVARDHFMAPVRYLAALNSSSSPAGIATGQNVDTAPLLVNSGYLDNAGNVVDFPNACYSAQSPAATSDCLKQNGIAHPFFDYQPVSRLATFHLIELGCYAALIAAALITLGLLVRKRRVG
ncbi:MAG TPA: hypothetical protein VHX38_12025 [Pseudonocardiaceae bacterium]|jgi:hypothetical protein|nr:hypothetical protein [Pseudonocardiaceae bacterium]